MDAHDTILVVDDEPGLVDLYAAWLRERYDVRTATDGEGALDALDDDIDAVLLDRQMPGLSGDETLERLRARGHECPVALVTAARPTADVIDLAFVEYLLKPVDREAILACVERLRAARGLDREARRWLRLASVTAIIEERALDGPDAETALIKRARREFERMGPPPEESIAEVFERGSFPTPSWEAALGIDPLAD